MRRTISSPAFRNLAAILVLGAALAAPLPLAAQDTLDATVTVTGEGTVDTVPDMATVWIGVTTRGDSASAAMAANAEAMQAVMSRLTESGIGPSDMQTSGLSLSPDYDSRKSYSSDETQPYVASNQLTVRILALDSVGEILDLAVTDGANTINGLTFGLQDPGPIMDQARKLAVAEAKRRATLYATELGMKTGVVRAISESGFADPGPMYRGKAAMEASTPIAGGEVAISTSVSMVMTLEQP